MVFAEQTGRAVETVDLLLRNSTDLLPDRARARPGEVTDLLRSRIANVRQVSALGIADASGVVVAASRTDLLGALPPAGMAELVKNRAEAEPRMHIGEPFRDPDNRWVAMMTRRLLAPEGQFAGIAIAYLNLAYFQDFYEAVDLPRTAPSSCTTATAPVLARFPRADKVVGVNYAREAAVCRCAGPRTGRHRCDDQPAGRQRTHPGHPRAEEFPARDQRICRAGGSSGFVVAGSLGVHRRNPCSAAWGWSECCCTCRARPATWR